MLRAHHAERVERGVPETDFGPPARLGTLEVLYFVQHIHLQVGDRLHYTGVSTRAPLAEQHN